MLTQESDTLYAKAFALYQQADYEAAEKEFQKLCQISPLEKTFWQGLAATLQMQNRWMQAAGAWAVCCLLPGENAWMHFHAAECFFQAKDKIQAKKALEQIVNTQDVELLQNIELLQQLLG
jgi:predicted Zn-dependent protease